MKNKIKLLGLGLGMAGISLLCQQAQANPTLLPGSSIGFMGEATANSTEIETIDSVTVAPVPAPTGSWAGLGGVSATFYTPISLAASSSAGVELWSVVSGLDTFQFYTTGNGAATTSTAGNVITTELTGTGYADEIVTIGGANVLANTAGIWGITLNNDGQSELLFTATTVTGVPDGGVTMMMLGGAFSVIGVLRRKLGSK